MKNIYVVGFPKSGNTWLIRMLARILRAEVVEFPMNSTGREISADINKEIRKLPYYRIYKIHFTPSHFGSKYKLKKDDKIIYIKRNIYDVLISSFFYFRYKDGDEKYLLKNPSLDIVANPVKLSRYFGKRKLLAGYIDNFCTKGNINHGKWNEHISLWSKFLNDKKVIKSVKTSYEKLSKNTEGELKRIIEKLGLKNINKDIIVKAIEKESVAKRKNEIKASRKKVTFGKKFNLRFIRKGKVGDYRRFLAAKQISFINQCVRKK